MDTLRAATTRPMHALDPAEVRHAADILRGARRALFITGAGISADSGLPTYRGIGGLYEDSATEDGVPIEVALSGPMLGANPALCWKHIGRIEEACRGAKHNGAHAFLAEFERRSPETWVLTQNVDGFHRDAGTRNLIEIHGNVHELFCMAKSCGWTATVPDYASLTLPPRCPDCSALVRPAVVLFGEVLPDSAIRDLQREAMRGFDAVVSIGTTSAFPYIAGPVVVAAKSGIPTIEINPGESEVSGIVSVRLRAGAAAALAAVRAALGWSADA
jgi:NAD-dependent deacetylase